MPSRSRNYRLKIAENRRNSSKTLKRNSRKSLKRNTRKTLKRNTRKTKRSRRVNRRRNMRGGGVDDDKQELLNLYADRENIWGDTGGYDDEDVDKINEKIQEVVRRMRGALYLPPKVVIGKGKDLGIQQRDKGIKKKSKSKG
jgi:ElaB/YqjD/DUF883 family membrane-anchored ribosome-binding protein